jgi:hypothetical protein
MRQRLRFASRLGVSGAFVALLYMVLGFGDLLCSLAAFSLGFAEANPVLAWLGRHELFVPGKIALTVVVAGMISLLYHRAQARVVAWSGVLAMVAVNAYHIIRLSEVV